MARIEYVDTNLFGEQQGDETNQGGSDDFNVIRMLAHLGEQHMSKFGDLVASLRYEGALDPWLREIAVLRMSHLAGCDYERVYHEIMVRGFGKNSEQIQAIYDGPESPVLTPVESHIVRFTDDHFHNYRAGDESFDFLEKALSRQELAELVMNIGLYQMSSSYMLTFDIELEDHMKNLSAEDQGRMVEMFKQQQKEYAANKEV